MEKTITRTPRLLVRSAIAPIALAAFAAAGCAGPSPARGPAHADPAEEERTPHTSEPVTPATQTRDLRRLPRAEADPNQPHPEGEVAPSSNPPTTPALSSSDATVRQSERVTPGTRARDLGRPPRAEADPNRPHTEGEVTVSSDPSTTTSSSSSNTTVQQSEPVTPRIQARDLRTLPRTESDPKQPHPEGGMP